MLKINFLSATATDADVLAFAMACKYESCDMMVAICNKQLAAKSKIVENKKGNYSIKEVEAAEAKIEELKASIEVFNTTMGELEDNYQTVIKNMTTPNDKGFANTDDQVRTVLRLITCAENRKFYEYATIPSLNDEELYKALEEIHVLNTVCEEGYSLNSKERKEAYKKAADRLDAIVRDMYSLPIATPYTSALKVKLNAEDRKAIHDVYVKGLVNKFEEDDDTGIITLKKYGVSTAVTKTKKGTDYSRLAKDIAMVVIRKYV